MKSLRNLRDVSVNSLEFKGLRRQRRRLELAPRSFIRISSYVDTTTFGRLVNAGEREGASCSSARLRLEYARAKASCRRKSESSSLCRGQSRGAQGFRREDERVSRARSPERTHRAKEECRHSGGSRNPALRVEDWPRRPSPIRQERGRADQDKKKGGHQGPEPGVPPRVSHIDAVTHLPVGGRRQYPARCAGRGCAKKRRG